MSVTYFRVSTELPSTKRQLGEIRFEFTKNSSPRPSVLSQLAIARMLSLTVLLLATPAVLGKIHADDDMVIVEGKSETECRKLGYSGAF